MSSKLGAHQRLLGQLPYLAHLLELGVALVILAAGQNIWTVVAGADPDITPPSVPANLVLTGRSATEIDISWDTSTDNVGVTGYHVYRNGAALGTTGTTTYSDTGLTPNTNYTYTVSAFDAAGNESVQSTDLPESTLADTLPPSIPTNLHQTGQTTTTVTVAWNASSDNVGVADYNIYRNGSLVKTQTGTTFTDTGLAVYSGYLYNVTALDAANNGSGISSTLVANTAQDITPPSVPDNVHETGSTISTVTLAWDASTDDVGVAGYSVYRNGVLVGSPGGTSFTDSGLSVSTNYTYTISAHDAANNVSAQSAPLNIQTAFDTTPPSTPTGLQTASQTDTSVSLSWSASTDNNTVSGYNVYRGNTLITSTVGTSYTDNGLSVNSSYTYRVQAYDASGNNSAQSVPLTASTLPDTTPPGSPSGLNSTAQTTTSVDLSWSATTDDVAVTGYRVYRDNTVVATVTGTTYSDIGLHYNTDYQYKVTAIDAAANESLPSGAITVSTLPDITPPTVNLTAPANGQTLQLTFPISATASDDLDLSKVNFYADSTLIATITSAPFALNWNSYAVHNGAHTLTAEAFDTTGNTSSQAVTITINNPPPAITGDLNGDHRVNLLDLSILLSHWGKSGNGDFNGNGRVDIFDLSTFLSHYGQDDSNYH